MVFPKVLWGLPLKPLRAAADGYSEFGRYMHELVDREKGVVEGKNRYNLCSTLVRHAAEQGKGDNRILTDDQIIGNTFIFWIAGQESTYAPPSLSLMTVRTLYFSVC
jgi:cytochrome P450